MYPVDLNKFSYLELEGLIKDEGYENVVLLIITRTTTVQKLSKEHTTDEARYMTSFVIGQKEVDVYIVHEVDKPEVMLDPLSPPPLKADANESGDQKVKQSTV